MKGVHRWPRRYRLQLLRESPWCFYCGLPLTVATATLDHLVPLGWGGTQDADNLALCCHECNTFKSCDPVSSFACPRQRGGKLRYVWEVIHHVGSFLSLKEPVMTALIVGFDYDALPDSGTREAAREHAAAIHGVLERTTAGIIEIGRRLIAVRKILGREFPQWMIAEFRWSNSTAYNFCQAAEKFGHLEAAIVNNFQPTALFTLMRPHIDPAAVKEAIKRSERGEIITAKTAGRIVQKHAKPGTLTATSNPVLRMRSLLHRYMRELPADDRRALLAELDKLADEIRMSLRTLETEATSSTSVPTPKPGRAGEKKSRRRKITPPPGARSGLNGRAPPRKFRPRSSGDFLGGKFAGETSGGSSGETSGENSVKRRGAEHAEKREGTGRDGKGKTPSRLLCALRASAFKTVLPIDPPLPGRPVSPRRRLVAAPGGGGRVARPTPEFCPASRRWAAAPVPCRTNGRGRRFRK
jgi:hypothetical protein